MSKEKEVPKVKGSPLGFIANLFPCVIAGFAGVGLGLETGVLNWEDDELSYTIERFLYGALLFPLSRATFGLASNIIRLSSFRHSTALLSGAFVGMVLGSGGRDPRPWVGSTTFAIFGFLVEHYSPYLFTF